MFEPFLGGLNAAREFGIDDKDAPFIHSHRYSTSIPFSERFDVFYQHQFCFQLFEHVLQILLGEAV
jgi:hypothetical protein